MKKKGRSQTRVSKKAIAKELGVEKFSDKIKRQLKKKNL